MAAKALDLISAVVILKEQSIVRPKTEISAMSFKIVNPTVSRPLFSNADAPIVRSSPMV